MLTCAEVTLPAITKSLADDPVAARLAKRG